MGISPEMLKKMKGKAPAMEISMGAGRKPSMGSSRPDMSKMEGSPEEEAAESPEESAAEGDEMSGAGGGDMPDLTAIPTDVLMAEVAKRHASGSDDEGAEDDGSSYFQDSEDEDKMA